MGCDIHGYIEYSDINNQDGSPYYRTFAENIGDRAYAMFGILAGVRDDGCLFSPKGFPKDASWSVQSEFCLYISEDESNDYDGHTTRSEAERWIADGTSKRWDDHRITHPDWHTPSWLTVEEYEKCLSAYGDEKGVWSAILRAMQELPNARFVFWFDN